MNWYLDSNICIECLRGKAPSIQQYLRHLQPFMVKIPSMVKAELMHGAMKSSDPMRNRELVEDFCSHFEVVGFDDAAVMVYAAIRTDLESRGSVIGANDIIIAATVMANSGVLVSSNISEFARVKGLRLENWVELDLSQADV